MNKIKHLPNLITFSRIICSFLLLFTQPLTAIFFFLYLFCGISDVLDGYIARKARTSSQFGAIFDSISDVVFIGISLIIFIPLFPLTWWMLFWIGGIALVRLISLVIGFVKYHMATFLHTYANKATGLAVFCSPFLYSRFGIVITIFIVCSLASVSAIEELAINLVSKKRDLNIRSIFTK